jgi:phosphate starvation-inducible protein PhoH and related proteins
MSKKNRSKEIENGTEKREDKSSRIPQRNKIDFNLNIYERNDLTGKQKQFIELVEDKKTRVVFVSGVAGTAKTFLSVYCGLRAMNKKQISDIVYIRSIIESASKSLGSLPGDEKMKLLPFMMPLYDKLEELLPNADINALTKQERVVGIPVNFLRGASYNAKFIIADEAANFSKKELITILTRLGEFSKLIICGDPNQSDINGSSGFMPMFDLFNDESSRENGIHCFSFTKEDIVRSGILKYIVEKLEYVSPPIKLEPMFPKK